MDTYTIYQVADILKTSHTTIYNKLDNQEIKKEMRNFIVKNGKQRLIMFEGVEILKKHIPQKETLQDNLESEVIPEQQETPKSIDNIVLETLLKNLESKDNKFIESLQSQIQEQQEQLKVKDAQIQSLSDALGTSQKLNENNQVLLRQVQDKIFLIEGAEHPQPEEKKSLFKRWFS